MKRWMVVGVMAVFLAACGSDGAAVANTAQSPVPTSVVVTTAATTTPDPTPTSTSTTTTSTTTTLPATTTTTVPTEALINQAVQDYFVAYLSCGQSPAECDPAAFTAGQGPSRGIVTELATGMVANGLYFSQDTQGSYLVAESVATTSDPEVTAIYCAFDGLIVVGPEGPDGLPTVVNDNVVSYQYQYRLFLEDGRWRVGEQHQLERLGAGNLCPPAA